MKNEKNWEGIVKNQKDTFPMSNVERFFGTEAYAFKHFKKLSVDFAKKNKLDYVCFGFGENLNKMENAGIVHLYNKVWRLHKYKNGKMVI